MRVLVTGGCGYIGSWLVPHLLAEGHFVTVLDPEDFGNGALPDNDNLSRKVDGDYDAVIILGGITQDLQCEADPARAREANIEALYALPSAPRIIYASSTAAYGSTHAPALETDSLKPTTLYGRLKAEAEDVLRQLYPQATIVRAASVCGYSPNMRFDTPVNAMTLSALRNGVIKVAGGEQWRTHIHIKDLSDFYKLLLKAPLSRIQDTFNVLGVNETVMGTAKTVSEICKAPIEQGPRTDDRSYMAVMLKALDLGFEPQWEVGDAVRDIQVRMSNHWPDATSPRYRRLLG